MAKKNGSKVARVSEMVLENEFRAVESVEHIQAEEEQDNRGNVDIQNPNKKVFVNYHNWPESVQLDRKTRKIGSDDLKTAAEACKYGREAGLDYTSVEIAYDISVALTHCVELSLEGKHEEAGKNAASALHILRGCRDIGDIEVTCRDGETRCVGYICKWYSNLHLRIAEEVQEMKVQEEAMVKAAKTAEVLAETMAEAEVVDKAKLAVEAKKLATKAA